AQRADGTIQPRLTELQGFPSLLAFQYYLSRDFQEAYALPPELRFLGDGLNDESFARLLRRAVLGHHSPEPVALVDVHPLEQSKRPDFQLTERLCPGLSILCPTQLKRRGRKLYYTPNGREVPLHRIFHRVVWEELRPYEHELSFRYRDDLDVEW